MGVVLYCVGLCIWHLWQTFILLGELGYVARFDHCSIVVSWIISTIHHINVSMRLFGSTGEPDGRGDGIWDGGLVVSL